MKIIGYTFLAINIFLIMITNCAVAKDFGTHGSSFTIKEEGFVAMLKRRLGNLDIAEHQKKMQDLARKRVFEPKPVVGITRASKTVTHSFDPSYILDKDVVLPCGKIMYQAGTVINPLDHMSWDGSLVFIDSNDAEQVQWLKAEFVNSTDVPKNDIDDIQTKNQIHKIVLVAGRPLELEQELDQNIYFDQFGELTTKFNIKHVPAIVEQDGSWLKITEINI